MRYASRIEPSQPLFRSRARAWTALSALSGALFALVAPPTSLVPRRVGRSGGARVRARRPTARRASWLDGGGRGLAFGFGANVVLLRFVPAVIARFTPLPFAAGVLALVLLARRAGGRLGGRGGRAERARPRAKVPRPVAFALGVYAATFVPSVFPWTPAAGLTPWPALVQLADAIGERGVSALVALVGRARSRTRRARRALQPQERLAGARAGARAQRSRSPFSRWRSMAARECASVDALRTAAPTASIGLVEPSSRRRRAGSRPPRRRSSRASRSRRRSPKRAAPT